MPTTPHRWTFVRAGGVDQVVFRSGADIARLGELDLKLWAALACPTRGLELDARTLDLIDTDHDGRIRAPELIAAARWACARLADPDLLLRRSDRVPLAAIAAGDDEGGALAGEARSVLGLVGRGDAAEIELADVLDRARLLDATPFDGDGLVGPATAGDDASLAAALAEIGQTQGSTPDRRGEPGVDRARVEAFFEQVAARDEWRRRGEADPALRPLGDSTAAALALVERVEAKIDDWYARCGIAAFEPRALPSLSASEKAFEPLAGRMLQTEAAELAALPLAAVDPRGELPLDSGLNPYWQQAIAELHATVIEPLLGEIAADGALVLPEAGWRRVVEILAPARRWLAERPGASLASLDDARIAELAQPALRSAVLELLDREDAAARQHALVDSLEKLLRLARDLLTLLENFVSFGAFYRREGAIFQAGRLYLDGRGCDLSVRVDDPARHAAIAGLAKAYLAYCECRRDGEKMQIVSAFTAGDVDFLFVGRNGIFFDRAGRDWDATITKVIENPTSISQAFFSPYKKFLRTLEELVAKRAAAADSGRQASLGAVAGRLANVGAPAAPAGAPAPAAPAARGPMAFDVGTIAALGVALGSLSTVAVAIFTKFVDLGWWIPVALVVIVLAISGPSMLIAWLKLRQRSLGPILDASGWAINGRLHVNVPLGGSLSQTARLPGDARRQLRDPYAPRRGPVYAWTVVLVVLVLAFAAWRLGWLEALLPAAQGRGGA
jgi:hypothetical protein